MDFRFTYNTYQDVRHNLFKYSVPFLVGAGFFTYFLILPPSHKQAVTGVLSYIANTEPWKSLLGAGVGLVVFVGLAFLLTEIFQVHDQWYDKYVTRWRHSYDNDFILPRLTQPFGSGLNFRFREEAESRTGAFMEAIYYPFVGDIDLKIPKNKLVRFYEVVTVYWLTQINEIVIFGMFMLVALYRAFGPNDPSYRTRLVTDLLILAVAFLLNRLWSRSILVKVRHATEQEIRAIHENKDLRADLKARLIALCTQYNVWYDPVVLNSIQ